MRRLRIPKTLGRMAGRGLVALLLLAGLMLAVGLAQAWAIRFARGDVPRDTLGYYTAASLVAQGQGHRLYDPSAVTAAQATLLGTLPKHNLQSRQEPNLLFFNPPFVAALFLPLALLPLDQAYLVWGLATWLLAAALAALCAAGATGQALWKRGLWFFASLTFAPVYAALLLGQISLALAVMAIGGWTLLRRGDAVLGGLTLSGLLIKPQYAILVIIGLLLARHWRAVAGFGLGTLAAGLLSLLVVGWDGALSYLRFLPRMASLWPDYGWNPAADYTWRGLAIRLLGEGVAADLLWGGLSAITLALVAMLWRAPWRPGDHFWDVRFAALLLGSVLASPHTLDYDLALLLPAGVVAWRGLRETKGRQWLAAPWLGIGIAAWSTLGAITGIGVWGNGIALVVPLMGVGLSLLLLGGSSRPAGSPLPASRLRPDTGPAVP